MIVPFVRASQTTLCQMYRADGSPASHFHEGKRMAKL